jgi:hypothetical protein
MVEGVRDLRTRMAAHVEIWAGGACAALHRRPPPELQVLDLPDIGRALLQWRARSDVSATAQQE